MSLERLNVITCELENELDHRGFVHRGTSIRGMLGTSRMGAAVYEAVEGHPIWPYHYHYATEEWLYVVSGAPVLRDPAGERALEPGDMVWFAQGPGAAHTMAGPGRFVMFSASRSEGPFISVYPDSDKISLYPGDREHRRLNALILPRAACVDYWYGEGDDGSLDPVEIAREPEPGESLPVVNVLGPADGERLGAALGAERAEPRIVDLAPGAEAPSLEHAGEELALVLTGDPTLRHPGGEDVLAPGDLVCFPDGAAGPHQLLNRTSAPARVAQFSLL